MVDVIKKETSENKYFWKYHLWMTWYPNHVKNGSLIFHTKRQKEIWQKSKGLFWCGYVKNRWQVLMVEKNVCFMTIFIHKLLWGTDILKQVSIIRKICYTDVSDWDFMSYECRFRKGFRKKTSKKMCAQSMKLNESIVLL